jgi:hypothetical protein
MGLAEVPCLYKCSLNNHALDLLHQHSPWRLHWLLLHLACQRDLLHLKRDTAVHHHHKALRRRRLVSTTPPSRRRITRQLPLRLLGLPHRLVSEAHRELLHRFLQAFNHRDMGGADDNRPKLSYKKHGS